MTLTRDISTLRAYNAVLGEALEMIEHRRECGDRYPVASTIGSLMSEVDRYLAEGLVHDAEITTNVIVDLEQLPS